MQGGGGGGGGNAMTFVHLNNETVTSKEQAEELVVQWRDLLMTAGIEVGVYVIEPHLLLLDTNDKSKVIQIKDFIVKEAPGVRPRPPTLPTHTPRPAHRTAPHSHRRSADGAP